jgi:WD40 repeat protein/DNA-binding SARP family transcriptional activator
MDAMAASRLEFRILGPLSVRVDGAPVAVGGPKQRALLALLLMRANRVVSRERLIGELFAEQSLNTADHALRNQVSRLRKVLAPAAADEPRLVARPPGYLLRVEPGELDLEHFEQLVEAGREALAAGDAAAAAESLRAAERLWEGRPLADLEFEPFAQVEVERLEEIRLAAVEERIDAELALGRQLGLVSELEALGAEHPYRERFRAQLMLALYRCGRQAEGLDVYRRTRTLLNEQLGLEPGVELQELERAILVQDPALTVTVDGGGKAASPLRDVCPFKGLAPFEAGDAELFFGRERLVEELAARLAEVPLLAVVGPSGSGKSSLLRAGLLPALGRECVVVRPGELSAAELTARVAGVLPGERLVLAVDQFEELFAPSVAEDERRAFVDALVEAAWDPERRTLILVGLRADFFGRLAPYVELADLVAPNYVLLGSMSAGELRRAIEGPAEWAGLEVEPVLVDALIDDVAGETGGLPLLSTALLDLWRERDGGILTYAAYERTGGVRSAVGRYAEAAFRSLGDDEQKVARRILLRLVDEGETGTLTRRRATRDELDADDDRVARVLATLFERRLLVADDGTVELVHEALLERWPRLVDWLEEDAQGRRLHRHLTQAASEWDAEGRDPSALYRGARLAATLEWADSADDDAGLNRLECQFLEESRTAFARASRRLRALLALAVLLLVAALVAGAVALAARGSARRQATAAIAQRLGAQALVESRLDRALLLAREGVNLDDAVATRSNLLATLLRSPAALVVLHGGGARVLDDALSRDGRTLAVRSNDGSVTFFDARTLGEVGPGFKSIGQISYFGAIVRPVRAVAFSPDGRTLAVGDSDGFHATLFLVDTRTHRARASITSPANQVTADVAFAPGGGTVVTGEAVSGHSNPPAEVLVARQVTDGRLIRRSKPIPGGRLVGYTKGGRFLLVTSGETRSYLLDPQTFARVRSFPVSGAAALSPAGDTAAFGQDDGSVKLVALRTGTERPMGRRATGRVIGLAFSSDGRVLATASDDGSVDVWDVPTATLRETLTGHAAAALGLFFSPDGATLYSGSSDGSVIVWDVRGGRRLGRPFRFDPAPSAGQGVHTPAQNAATAVAVSPDSSLFVTTPGPNRVTLWRARDQAVLGELRGPCGRIVSLAFSHDGRLVAATGSARETVVWNVATHKIVTLLGPGSMGSAGVAFSPDDRLLGTAGSDGTLRVYDLRTGRRIGKVQANGTLQDLDFSSDGKLVTAAGLGGDIVIWNLARRTLERTIHHKDAILSIRFSPDGKTIATGDLPGNVDFWDPTTGRRVGRTLGGQNGYVLSVTFNPSGTQVVTTSSDGKLRLWDLASGKLVGAPLPGADTGGWGTFFPDGKRVIAVFGSGTGVVWNVDPVAWETQACRAAHRNLTRSEWRDFLPQRGYRHVCP